MAIKRRSIHKKRCGRSLGKTHKHGKKGKRRSVYKGGKKRGRKSKKKNGGGLLSSANTNPSTGMVTINNDEYKSTPLKLNDVLQAANQNQQINDYWQKLGEGWGSTIQIAGMTIGFSMAANGTIALAITGATVGSAGIAVPALMGLSALAYVVYTRVCKRVELVNTVLLIHSLVQKMEEVHVTLQLYRLKMSDANMFKLKSSFEPYLNKLGQLLNQIFHLAALLGAYEKFGLIKNIEEPTKKDQDDFSNELGTDMEIASQFENTIVTMVDETVNKTGLDVTAGIDYANENDIIVGVNEPPVDEKSNSSEESLLRETSDLNNDKQTKNQSRLSKIKDTLKSTGSKIGVFAKSTGSKIGKLLKNVAGGFVYIYKGGKYVFSEAQILMSVNERYFDFVREVVILNIRLTTFLAEISASTIDDVSALSEFMIDEACKNVNDTDKVKCIATKQESLKQYIKRQNEITQKMDESIRKSAKEVDVGNLKSQAEQQTRLEKKANLEVGRPPTYQRAQSMSSLQ